MHQFDRIKKTHLVTNTASLAIFIVFVVSNIKLTLLYFSLCKWVLVMERKYFYTDWMVVVLQTWFTKGDNTGFIVFINLDLAHSFSSHILNESTPLDFYSCNYLFLWNICMYQLQNTFMNLPNIIFIRSFVYFFNEDDLFIVIGGALPVKFETMNSISVKSIWEFEDNSSLSITEWSDRWKLEVHNGYLRRSDIVCIRVSAPFKPRPPLLSLSCQANPPPPPT